MSALAVRRSVEDYLRREYGVREFDYSQNKHGKLRFAYPPGVPRTLTLPVSAGHDDASAITMKRQNVRALLGPPPALPEAPSRRRLEDMMPEAFNTPLAALAPLAERLGQAVAERPAEPPRPDDAFPVRVAHYYGKGLRVFAPAAALPVGYEATKWEASVERFGTLLRPSARGGRWAEYGRSHRYLEAPRGSWSDDLGCFGVSPATCERVGGELRVTIDPTRLVPVQDRIERAAGPQEDRVLPPEERPPTLLGRLSLTAGDRLHFSLPEGLAAALPASAYVVRRVPTEAAWELRPVPGRKTPLLRRSPYGDRSSYTLDWTDHAIEFAPFRQRTAEFSWDGARVLARVADPTGIPLKPGRDPLPMRIVTEERAAPPAPSDAPDTVPHGAMSDVPTPSEMRDCLAEIRRIERLTERRLVKRASDGAWVFKAELIE